MKNATEQQHTRSISSSSDGSYPLYMAISSGAPIEELQILIKADTDVASKTNKFGHMW